MRDVEPHPIREQGIPAGAGGHAAPAAQTASPRENAAPPAVDDTAPAVPAAPVPPASGPREPDGRITLRFLAAPTDAGAHDRSVPGGRVLEWIDKAGYACAVGWAGTYCVTAYVGNVHFTRAIHSGDLVEVHARIILTGRSSMHVLVTVQTSDVRRRHFSTALDCILVFVAVGDDGRPTAVPRWAPEHRLGEELRRVAQQRLEHRTAIQSAMAAQAYTDEGTAPRAVFRFLAAPTDVNWGGNAHGGIVMRWIDEAAYACAASWSSEEAIAVYSGGIAFLSPIHIGDLVEVDARLIHTSEHSMHVSIQVRSAPVTRPDELRLTTRCMSIFVDRGPDGRAAAIRPLPLISTEDRRLDAHALDLIRLRKELAPLPPASLR